MPRIQVNNPETEFYPIPSEAKQEGWENFIAMMPDLLGQGLTTRELMPSLHAATTSGVKLQEVPDTLIRAAAVNLLAQGRPQEAINKVLESVRLDIFSVDKAQEGRILPDTRCKVDMPRIAHLRQFGTRSVNQRLNETVYAAHLKPFDVGGPEPLYYTGLAEGLEAIFTELCQRFDELMEKYKNAPVGIKVRIIAYFQMWGASIIHPFFDANGRAFGAKLVFDLNKIGLPIKKIPALGEINPDLAENVLALAGERFLQSFLMKNGLPLFNAEQATGLTFNARYWKKYNDTLRSAITDGIRQGINPEPDYAQFLESVCFCLQMVLSRDGHVDPRFYQSQAPAVIAQQREIERAAGVRG